MIGVENEESPPAGFLIAGTLTIQSMKRRSRQLTHIMIRQPGLHSAEDVHILRCDSLIPLPSSLYNAGNRSKVSSLPSFESFRWSFLRGTHQQVSTEPSHFCLNDPSEVSQKKPVIGRREAVGK